MNQKEINELRRRFRPEKSAISRVYGCYVNSSMPGIVDIIQFPGTAGGNGPGITAYLCELDAGILGELLPQEVQPLSRYALHLHLSHSNPNIRLI